MSVENDSWISWDALRAKSDLLAYGPCHLRDGTAGTATLDIIGYRCYHRRALPLSVKTMGRLEQPENAATAVARATCMSLLWAGGSSWWAWAGSTQCYAD